MIFTISVIILIIAAANYSKIIDMFDDENNKVGIVSSNENIVKAIKNQEGQLKDDEKFVRISKNDVEEQLRSDKIVEAYIVNVSKTGEIEGEILSKEAISDQDKTKLQGLLTQLQTRLIASNLNISQSELSHLQAQSNVSSKTLDTDNNSNLTEPQQLFNNIITYFGIMFMFFIIINYASQLAMEIATEKTSRVTEMIITSVSPITHVLAKICGIVSVALTQILIFITVATCCFHIFDVNEAFKDFDIQPSKVTVQLVIVGVLNLILGVLSYTILAAILGAITSRIEDVTQSLTPLTLTGLIAFYISIFGVTNLDTPLTKITSFIPFFSPFVMFVRAGSLELQTWEIMLSGLLSIIMICILLWLVVKSYKDSVLNFDKGFKSSIKLLFRRN